MSEWASAYKQVREPFSKRASEWMSKWVKAEVEWTRQRWRRKPATRGVTSRPREGGCVESLTLLFSRAWSFAAVSFSSLSAVRSSCTTNKRDKVTLECVTSISANFGHNFRSMTSNSGHLFLWSPLRTVFGSTHFFQRRNLVVLSSGFFGRLFPFYFFLWKTRTAEFLSSVLQFDSAVQLKMGFSLPWTNLSFTTRLIFHRSSKWPHCLRQFFPIEG